jgi:adenosylcobinamide kinase/adenosylcobinamide-phosphate guanylyltransferase
LIIGGCRSGKSRYALETASGTAGQEKIFIATLVPQDKEMEARIRRHQKERNQNWKTVETPLLLPEAIAEHDRPDSIIVVDCLTLWLNNLLMKNDDPETIDLQIHRLTQTLETTQCPVYLVANEVGSGIVPENRLARLFRDMAGFCNQQVAACADRVIWMVAGIPVTIKGDL